jgi:hypothetical protein
VEVQAGHRPGAEDRRGRGAAAVLAQLVGHASAKVGSVVDLGSILQNSIWDKFSKDFHPKETYIYLSEYSSWLLCKAFKSYICI